MTITSVILLLPLISCSILILQGTLKQACENTNYEIIEWYIQNWPIGHAIQVARLLESYYYDFQTIYNKFEEPSERQELIWPLYQHSYFHNSIFSLPKIQGSEVWKKYISNTKFAQYEGVIGSKEFDPSRFTYDQRYALITRMVERYPKSVKDTMLWQLKLLENIPANQVIVLIINSWMLFTCQNLLIVLNMVVKSNMPLENFAIELLASIPDELLFSQMVKLFFCSIKCNILLNRLSGLNLFTILRENMTSAVRKPSLSLIPLLDTKQVGNEGTSRLIGDIFNHMQESLEMSSTKLKAFVLEVIIDLLTYDQLWSSQDSQFKEFQWFVDNIDINLLTKERYNSLSKTFLQNSRFNLKFNSNNKNLVLGLATIRDTKRYLDKEFETWKKHIRLLLPKDARNSGLIFILEQTTVSSLNFNFALWLQLPWEQVALNMIVDPPLQISPKYSLSFNIPDLLEQFIDLINNTNVLFERKSSKYCWVLNFNYSAYTILIRSLKWFLVYEKRINLSPFPTPSMETTSADYFRKEIEDKLCSEWRMTSRRPVRSSYMARDMYKQLETLIDLFGWSYLYDKLNAA